jgi:hypothetical protein
MYRVENGECLEDRRLSQLWIPCTDRRFKTPSRLDLRFCRLALHRVSIVDTIRRFQCAVKGTEPQRDEKPARKLDRSTL